tara:strand:- start:387 stop:962 length:576 start_codon:yes stop_codon:yes gene_type:complete
MFKIGKTLISEEIIENNFHCNLSACKGACCIEGNSGAPLEKNEAEVLEREFEKISPYISNKAKKVIQQKGKYVYDKDGNLETPIINGKECVYVSYNSNGTLECGIEKAFDEGKINLKKPISCHLYPIRVKKYSSFTAVNYHKWNICSDACELGKILKKPIYQFVKDALIRRFGISWYLELEKVSKELKKIS